MYHLSRLLWGEPLFPFTYMKNILLLSKEWLMIDFMLVEYVYYTSFWHKYPLLERRRSFLSSCQLDCHWWIIPRPPLQPAVISRLNCFPSYSHKVILVLHDNDNKRSWLNRKEKKKNSYRWWWSNWGSAYLFIFFYIKTLYRIELIIPAREKSHLIQVCQDRRDPTEVICWCTDWFNHFWNGAVPVVVIKDTFHNKVQKQAITQLSRC